MCAPVMAQINGLDVVENNQQPQVDGRVSVETKESASFASTSTIKNNIIRYPQTICSGETPAMLEGLTPQGGTGSYTYLWQSTINGPNEGWGKASGNETTKNYNFPSGLTVTRWFRRVVTSGDEMNISDPIEITVTPLSVGGTASPSVSTICEGGQATLTLTGFTGSIYWQRSPNGQSDWVNVTDGSGATNATYQTARLSATTYFRAVVTSGVCSTASSNVVAVVVNGQTAAPTAASSTASVICPAEPTTLVATGGMAAYYPFSSNTNDASGSGLNLTGSGGTFVDGGLRLSANARYTSSSTSILNTDKYTLSFEIKFPVSPSTGYNSIFQFVTSDTDRSPGIWRLPSANGLHWRHDPGNVGIDESFRFNQNQWYTVTGVKNGNVFTLYVDGKPVATGSVPVSKSPGLGQLLFGKPVNGNTSGADVIIKEFKLYNGDLKWYAGSCGGTPVGSGPTLVVNPLITTTYYVQNEGLCNTTDCVSTTVTVNPLAAAPTTTGAQIVIAGIPVTLSANGATNGQFYKWYDAPTGGNLLKRSTSYTDRTYQITGLTATTSYWVAVENSTGCDGPRAEVVASFPAISSGDQSIAGSNSWVGHVYDGMGFTSYYGTVTEAETFDQYFGGLYHNYAISAPEGPRYIHTETFSIRYRMNSTKRGLYVFTLGADDYANMVVDGVTVITKPAGGYQTLLNAVASFTGTSSVLIEYYENTGDNRMRFTDLNLVLANALQTSGSQTISMGQTGAKLSGDVYGKLPQNVSLHGTGYQWAYRMDPEGEFIDIAGATAADYTPVAGVAPFTLDGDYYIVRKAMVKSTANSATHIPVNISNELVITVNTNANAYTGGIGGGSHELAKLKVETYDGSVFAGGNGSGDVVSQHSNMWKGDVSSDWSNTANWTGAYEPHAADAVVFATVANNGSAAANNLIVNGKRTIGDLTNETTQKLIVAPSASLVVAGAINTNQDKERILIQANSTQPAGTFIFPQSQKAFANVEFYSKAITPNDVNTSSGFVWQYMGVPVKTFSPNTLHGWYMRQYHEEAPNGKYWVQLTNSSVLTPFAGYQISRKESTSATGLVTFFGELENASRVVPLSVSSSNSLFSGQHVVSNPYTAALKIATGLSFGEGVDATVHLFHTGSSNDWDANGGTAGEARAQYLSVPQGQAGFNGLPSTIASMQGFVVRANTHNAELAFNYAGVSTENSMARFKVDDSHKLGTQITLLKGDAEGDKAWVFAEAEHGTDGFDNGWDSRKLLTNNADAFIYTETAGERLQVNSKKSIENTVIAFKAERDILDYKLKFQHLNVDQHYTQLYLFDLSTNKIVDITANNSEYAFSAINTAEAENRFLIQSTIDSNPEHAANNVFVIKENNRYLAVNKLQTEVDVLMYDISGRLHSKQLIPASGVVELKSDLTIGVYLVKFNGAGVRKTEKLIIE